MKHKKTIIAIILAIIAALAIGLIGFSNSASAKGRGLRIPKYAYTVYNRGDCDWLEPYLIAAELPVQTFQLISARESHCREEGVNVNNRTDLSVSRFGVNFRTAALRRGWANWCGATHYTQLRDVELDVACVAAAYQHMGLRPWGG